MPRIEEKALNTELAKHGFESVAVKRQLPAGRLELEANKLHPVHVEGSESIYAPSPVSLSVELDARGRVTSIDGGTPDPAAAADAARSVKTLRDNGQLAAAGEQPPATGLTHRIDVTRKAGKSCAANASRSARAMAGQRRAFSPKSFPGEM